MSQKGKETESKAITSDLLAAWPRTWVSLCLPQAGAGECTQNSQLLTSVCSQSQELLALGFPFREENPSRDEGYFECEFEETNLGEIVFTVNNR